MSIREWISDVCSSGPSLRGKGGKAPASGRYFLSRGFGFGEARRPFPFFSFAQDSYSRIFPYLRSHIAGDQLKHTLQISAGAAPGFWLTTCALRQIGAPGG